MDVQRALELREEGTPWKEIVAELGVNPSTLRYHCDKAGVERTKYERFTKEDIEAVRKLRAQGVSWESIECKFPHHRKYMQRRLNEK